MSTATLTHAVPAGPNVFAKVGPGDTLIISWEAVTTRVKVSPQFVASLAPGEHTFEVLAIEAGGNQTITKGSFTKP